VDRIERAICPGEGACGGMYTANTMASVAEALGMSLPGSAAPPAVDARRDGFAHRSGEAVVEMLRQGITARQIMTKPAFDNAIAVVMALGGSTNAVLHLLAIAHEAEVDLTLDDFNRVGEKVPHLGDLKPFGRYVMNDVDRIGGIPVVMGALLEAGLMDGDCLTVTGQDDGREPRRARPARRRRRHPAPLDNPSTPPAGCDPARAACARGRRREERRASTARLRGHRPRLRRREAAMDALPTGRSAAATSW
jgi:dihydroxy-acid dehydratase